MCGCTALTSGRLESGGGCPTLQAAPSLPMTSTGAGKQDSLGITDKTEFILSLIKRD